MLEQSENTVIGRVVRGSSARTAATLMTWGNIAAIVFIPAIIFWCGASMLVFALNRHHPNPRVGHYTQRAATLFYAVAGFFVVVATLIPSDNWNYYLLSWVLAALIIIPRSILDLISIYKEEWPDLLLEDDEVLSS
jgi:hypothetical protein